MTQSTFQTNATIEAARARVAHIGRLLFDRNLTDSAGGNISYRVGDLVCMSPTKSGADHQWQIDANHVLVVDLDGNILDGDGRLSRESKVHLSLHREYGEYGKAVIHSHPRNVLVFASQAREMPPVLEANRKFGVTPVIDYAPAHSGKLAKFVVESMRGREQRIQNHAAGTIAPWHGIFLMGNSLDAAFDAVERMDTNAYCILMGRLLPNAPTLDAQQEQMERVITSFREDD